MSLEINRPQGRCNRRPESAKSPLRLAALSLVLGFALAGCGGEASTVVSPQNSYSYSNTSPYSDAYYTSNPASPAGTNGDWTTDPYSDPYTNPYTDTLPVTPAEATPSTSVPSGVVVQLISKELPGILSWERCEAQITVTNHSSTPQQGYLIASFTLKGREVELQYRVLSLGANGNQTFRLKSTVQADDVRLEYRTKLL